LSRPFSIRPSQILVSGGAISFVDCSGFENYELKCAECGAALIGVIDPRDDQLLLS
jgi:hypothetical protein